jgi:flagellar basal body-associated protein FliL
MNRGLTLIILAILIIIGAVVTMTSWQGTVSGPENTPETSKEVPAPPQQPPQP